jgi:hypothetical protein
VAKRYIIVTQHGYLGGDYPTKKAALKALREEVKASAKSCRRSHKRCSVIRSAATGHYEIKIGGRQGYHLWQSYRVRKD